MARKQEKVSRRMLFIWFMLAGCIMLFAPQSFTGKLQLAFVDIFRWPLSLGGNVALTARTQESHDGGFDVDERTRYENHIANLEQTIEEYKRKFRMQHKYTPYIWEGASIAGADVRTRAVDGPSNELMIENRMKVLKKGQYVLGGNSVIGTISDVLPQLGTARVQLITDSDSQIPVKIGNGNLRNILKGTDSNVAIIEQVKTKVDVGERVFALRKPGILDLDAPIITGKVSRCVRNPKEASTWDVTVVPVCDLQHIENVAVIVINPKAG